MRGVYTATKAKRFVCEVFTCQHEWHTFTSSKVYRRQLQLAALQAFVDFKCVCVRWAGVVLKRMLLWWMLPEVKAEHMKYK